MTRLLSQMRPVFRVQQQKLIIICKLPVRPSLPVYTNSFQPLSAGLFSTFFLSRQNLGWLISAACQCVVLCATAFLFFWVCVCSVYSWRKSPGQSCWLLLLQRSTLPTLHSTGHLSWLRFYSPKTVNVSLPPPPTPAQKPIYPVKISQEFNVVRLDNYRRAPHPLLTALSKHGLISLLPG